MQIKLPVWAIYSWTVRSQHIATTSVQIKRGVRHSWNLVHSTQKSTEIKPEITRQISEFWNQKSLKLRCPQSYYDSGNSQKSGNRVRNQEIRSEITLEIKKSHYKSTEIRLEINRNQIRNQEIRLEITWFRNLVRFMWPCWTPRLNVPTSTSRTFFQTCAMVLLRHIWQRKRQV
jgi:hypothetical protein